MARVPNRMNRARAKKKFVYQRLKFERELEERSVKKYGRSTN